MVKNYVVDTNIFIRNPDCINRFDEHHVYIPHCVLEELDGLKNAPGETGYSAREAIRNLKFYKEKGNLCSGAPTPGGGKLYLYMPETLDFSYLPAGFSSTKLDNLILLDVLMLKKEKENVILISNDILVQMKADLLGIEVQEFKNDRISDEIDLYTGRSTRYIRQEGFYAIIAGKTRPITDVYDPTSPEEWLRDQKPPFPNEFFVLKNPDGGSVLAKYDGIQIRPLDSLKKPLTYPLVSRNSGQSFLKEALLSRVEDHPLTICLGPAGTGKTLFALGCALHQVLKEKQYKRVLYCRPNVLMGEDLGALPGSEREKIDPLLRGAYDNLEVLLGLVFKEQDEIQNEIARLFERGVITAQSLAYLRGRSISGTYCIIDEAQNTTPSQILTILSRPQKDSKFVILGDPNQIDNPRLDKRNNGLVFAMERMKGSKLCEIITFSESECTRSPLAKEVSERLKR